MISKIRSNKSAFTLVEIMIVVAIIGLLAALAIPGFVKARKQSQGRRIINDVRQIDAAMDQWAVEKGKKDGDLIHANMAEVRTYLKTPLPVDGGGLFIDLMGAPYEGTWVVGPGQIQVAASTKAALAGVGIDWGQY